MSSKYPRSFFRTLCFLFFVIFFSALQPNALAQQIADNGLLQISSNRARPFHLELNSQTLNSIQTQYSTRYSSKSRVTTFLKMLEKMKPVFQLMLDKHDADFKGLAGYHFAAKVVSSMGLLGVLGDNEASAIAKRALLLAANPFRGAPISAPQARALLLDRNQNYATRIRAFNILQESGDLSTFPSRGEGIYLETSILAETLGFGYDWLFDQLNTEERQNVEVAIKEVLLWSNNLHKTFFTQEAPAEQRDSNWNAVMNGGSGILALAGLSNNSGFACTAVLANEPSPAQRRLASIHQLSIERICQALVGLRSYWNAFTPSGTYGEGPSYWFFGMENYTLFTDAVALYLGRRDLSNAFGDQQKRSAEVQQSLLFREDDFWNGSAQALTRLSTYSFADSEENLVPLSFPFLIIAEQATSPALRNAGIAILDQQIRNESSSVETYGTLWASHSLDWSRIFTILKEPNETASSWSEPRINAYSSSDGKFDLAKLSNYEADGSWIVFAKGGNIYDPHAHLDSSSFTLRIGGVSWLTDLGSEHSSSGYPSRYFALPSTPSYEEGLRFFRKNDLSHNLVSFPNRALNLSARAKLLSATEGTSSDGAPLSRAIWDTTALYAPVVTASTRQFLLTDRGRNSSLDVIDTFQFSQLPLSPSGTPIAVWHVTSCGDSAERLSGQLTQTALGPTARLTKKIISQTGGTSTNSSILLQTYRPLAVSPSITSANPAENPSFQHTLPGETESSNTGCLTVRIPAYKEQLLQNSAGGASLTFVVRIQKEVQ